MFKAVSLACDSVGGAAERSLGETEAKKKNALKTKRRCSIHDDSLKVCVATSETKFCVKGAQLNFRATIEIICLNGQASSLFERKS